MKKLVSLLLVLALFCTVAFVGVYAEGEEEEENLLEIVGITFDSVVEGEAVEFVRGGAESNAVLIDGDYMEGAQASPNHQAKGIVLIQNTRCSEAGVYPEYTYTLELKDKDTFDRLKIGFYEYFMAMIGLPKDNAVGVEASEDGSDWTFVGDYEFEGEALKEEVAGNVYVIDLGKAVTAKYVRLTFAFGDSPFGTAEYGNSEKVIWEWHGFTEFGVIGADTVDIGDTSEPETSEPEPETSEPTEPTEPAQPIEGDNVATGMNYTVEGNNLRNDNYDDNDSKKLTDGIVGIEASAADLLGFKAGDDGVVSVTLDLGEVKDFGSIVAYAVHYDGWGIPAPTSVTFSVSEDGETYGTEIEVTVDEAGVLEGTGTGAGWEFPTFVANGDFTGRYVKIDFNRNGAGHVWVSEVEIIAEAAAPVNPDPVNPDPVNPDPGVPQNGDAGIIALAVISVIALGGAVIVKKSK